MLHCIKPSRCLPCCLFLLHFPYCFRKRLSDEESLVYFHEVGYSERQAWMVKMGKLPVLDVRDDTVGEQVRSMRVMIMMRCRSRRKKRGWGLIIMLNKGTKILDMHNNIPPPPHTHTHTHTKVKMAITQKKKKTHRFLFCKRDTLSVLRF